MDIESHGKAALLPRYLAWGTLQVAGRLGHYAATEAGCRSRYLSGIGRACLKGSSPQGCEVITVDSVPWTKVENCALRPADFEDGRLRQVIGDLSEKSFFNSFAATLAGCDLLFVDAPKNVVFERAFLQHLSIVRLPPKALVLFDDIRQWNMLELAHNREAKAGPYIVWPLDRNGNH